MNVFYYVIGLFYSSIIGNIFALGVHTIQIYPHLIHQVAIVLINDTLRLEIERVMLNQSDAKTAIAFVQFESSFYSKISNSLKVSKSQKAFFLETPLSKKETKH